MNEALIDRIRGHEGLTLIPKPDAKGMYEIGYGHDITPDQAQELASGIDQDTADDWLLADVVYAKGQVRDKIPWVTASPTVVFDVLTEMAFQMGIESLLEFSGTLKAIQAGDYKTASQHMLASLWHEETPARCEELANLILTAYSSSSITT